MLGLIEIFDKYDTIIKPEKSSLDKAIEEILIWLDSCYDVKTKEFCIHNCRSILIVWNFLYLAKVNGIEIEYFKFNNKKVKFEKLLEDDYLSEKYLENIKTLKIKIT